MKVHIAETYAAPALARLKALERVELVETAATAEILLIRSQTRVNADLLKNMPKLRLIVSASSGFDHIDWRACREKDILISYTPDANASSTAELTLFLMIALNRQLPRQIDNAQRGQWRSHLTRGDSLEGKTLGIIGLGRIGQRVANLAKAFGMSVVGHDPFLDAVVFETMSVERLALIEVLRLADIVTLHVPLTAQTKHLINSPTLREMQPMAFLINASRGEVVDESEVLVALREKRLAGAALDVLEREPPLANSELLKHPNVIVTPHVGAFTRQAFERGSLAAVERVIRFLDEKSIPDTIPPQVPWFD